ncbi:dual oxidase maturation factor 1 [Ixodes scapularis]|uniref:dual oxidase maturation factor 1 n=1 Tax=Ixodes scapularis TaxID=6945 RepID=UPI001A9CE831|nr:dual oxidase maturation factor 1 [Ixodes scapularis]
MDVMYRASAWFSALRDKPFPTMYGENKTAVTADVLEAGLILAFCILTFAFLLLLPGVRGGQKINVLVRVGVSLFIGAFILLCNFGQEWEVSKIRAVTPYRAFSHQELHAEIEVKIGLRSVNITLRNETVYEGTAGDKVDYNERFTWAWEQGRAGFGPQAGHFNRDFRTAQVKGTPFPILWIAEYFTFDGEGIRFGRHYRTAGWYTHILLWTAFPLWVVSNLVFFTVLWYGACVLILTGSCLIAGTIVYASVRNFIPLEVPFYDGDQLVHVRMTYGWCFWMNLVNGLVCLLVGIVVLFMDLRYPDIISTFFGIDILQDYEEIYEDPAELTKKKKDAVSVPLTETALLAPSSPPPDYSNEGPEYEAPALRKRTVLSRYQRSSIRKPAPAPRRLNMSPTLATATEEDDDNPIYENTFQPDRHDGAEDGGVGNSKENILLATLKR